MTNSCTSKLAACRTTASKISVQQFTMLTQNKPAFRLNGECARLKSRLAQRSAHWTATALQTVRERSTSLPASEDGRSIAAADPDVSPPPASTTSVAQRIDNLRKECGWSFDQLAKATGLDKKLILRHVNLGRSAHPRTPKTYADAFARALKLPITPNDIAG